MFCWTSFSEPRWLISGWRCNRLKDEDKRGKSCRWNGLPPRHFLNKSSPACKVFFDITERLTINGRANIAQWYKFILSLPCGKIINSLRADVWSFGILMFEVLTIGENPYYQHRIKNKDYKEKMKIEYEWARKHQDLAPRLKIYSQVVLWHWTQTLGCRHLEVRTPELYIYV